MDNARDPRSEPDAFRPREPEELASESELSAAIRRRPSLDSCAGYGKALDEYGSELDLDSLATESVANQSANGGSYASRTSRADSRLDRDLKDAIAMVKVSDQKIGALRKMHAQYLLRRVEEALGTGANQPAADTRQQGRLLGPEHEDADFDASDSDSDRSDSVTDSAFIYKAQAAQKFAAGGLGSPEFDRMSQRLEKDLGLGNDMDSLISVERGGADFAQVGPGSVVSDGDALQYTATAFNGADLETGSIFSKDDDLGPDEERWRKRFRRRVKINWIGSAIFTFFVLAFGFYLWVRITKTMDLGKYLAYGIFVLVVEVMGATATMLYGITLLLDPLPPETYKNQPPIAKQTKRRWGPSWRKPWGKKKRKASDLDGAGSVKDELDVEASADSFSSAASGTSANSGTTMTSNGISGLAMLYHIRVLIPCYKEDFEIVQKTLNAIREAALPVGCQRTVYLLDDGKDKKKRKWASRLGPDVVYVSGRHRAPDESNGKSGNLNNALTQIYPDGIKIPPHEIVCIMDADQIADPTFFMKTLPLLDDGDDIAMVLSPQCFHNVHHQADIFNHTNIHFWEYMQIGYDALSFISCTGTNFLIRANAFQECGWSPTWTLTEDFALGMELKKRRWQCRYMREYLAVGEAPEQVRNCFQQKSRWCKGHFQVFFHNEHCPLFQSKLSVLQRIMYCQGVWSYVVGAISTPTFVVVPLVTIWAGVFPIVLNWWAAIGLSVFYAATTMVLNYCRNRKHIYPLWFSGISNQIMWWTYVKAFWRGVAGATGAKITFKTTLKGTGRIMASVLSDLWMPCVVFILLTASFITGIKKLVDAGSVSNTLMISIVWVVYNMIPQYLLIHYTWIGRGGTLQFASRLAFLLTTALGVGAMVLIWLFYPATYDFGTALNDSHYFYRTQRVGVLPDTSVPWRSNSLLQEYAIPFSAKDWDFGGGWMTGREVGTVKVTMPIAWTTAMLAWGLQDFLPGYKAAGAYNAAILNVKWGTDYLLKTVIGNTTTPTNLKLVWQVGNLTYDEMYWTRPENINGPRPFYYVAVKDGNSDLLGQLIGAFASAAPLFQTLSPAYYTQLLTMAQALYGVMIGPYQGYYQTPLMKQQCITSISVASALQTTGLNCNPPWLPLNGSTFLQYNSTTYNDDMAWAATWMYRATGDPAYLNDAKAFFGAYQSSTEAVVSENLVVDWNNNYWSTAVLLASLTDLDAYHYQAQTFLGNWICSTSNVVTYTKQGRAWNANKGSVDVTMNVAAMGLIYGNAVKTNKKYMSKSDRYICWAKGQMRYVLGDVVTGFVVGFPNANGGYTRPQDRASSCPSAPAVCNAITAYYNPQANPHVLLGALLEGPSDGTDSFPDVRTDNGSQVAVENNAGFSTALVATYQTTEPSWPECLQGYGFFRKDPVCSYLRERAPACTRHGACGPQPYTQLTAARSRQWHESPLQVCRLLQTRCSQHDALHPLPLASNTASDVRFISALLLERT